MADDDPYAELVQAVATTRDRVAFVTLYDHFAPRIYAFLIRLGSDTATAEELTQEVMVTLWRKAALFDRSKSSTATWLFRIARNRRIDLKRRDRSALIDVEDPALQPPPSEAPDASIASRQRDGLVRQALDALPSEQVALVELSFFKGLSHSEIAEETGLPLGTVKSRLRLAFGRLRRNLEDTAADEVR